VNLRHATDADLGNEILRRREMRENPTTEAPMPTFTLTDAEAWPPAPPVPEVERGEIATLYSLGHYDGPATGLVRWRSRIWYVRRMDRDERPRRFWLVEIPQADAAALMAWSEARVLAYGPGMAWNPDGSRRGDADGSLGSHTAPEFQAKADAWRKANPVPDLDLSGAAVVGWFCSWRDES
jgi:hypothetical protein